MKNRLHWLIVELWECRRRRLYGWLSLVLIFIILARTFLIATVFVYRDLINALLPHTLRAEQIPILLLCLYGGLQLFATLFLECRDLFLYPIIRTLTTQLRLKTLQAIYYQQSIPINDLSGVIVNQAQRGLNGIDTTLTIIVTTLIPGIIELTIISLAVALLFPIYFFMILSAGNLLYLCFTIITNQSLQQKRFALANKQGHFQHVITEGISHRETIALFTQENHEIVRANAAEMEYQAEYLKVKHRQSLINIGKQSIMITTLLIMMFLSTRLVLQELASLGDFIIINFLLAMCIQPIVLAGSAVHSLKQALIDLQGLESLIKKPQLTPIKTIKRPEGHLIFRDITFTYPGQTKPVLQQFNLTIHPSESVAIVGESGRGKSTLIKLLLGFYTPNQGDIILDGKKLSHADCRGLRSYCGVVNQEVQLFHQTIAFNIAYGSVNASHNDIKQAAKIANIDEFIESLPQGYETLVGERGVNLSGGQRQRIAIARAILRKPALFIFDEPTSALDIETETKLMHTIKAITNNHTTLFITHRMHLANLTSNIIHMR